ncbi:MAG: hypothetical protein IT385_03690 [Deltaproteobacteria bacterium]|nr:hypothetical protein [Deltaproteobacteria bacterium]
MLHIASSRLPLALAALLSLSACCAAPPAPTPEPPTAAPTDTVAPTAPGTVTPEPRDVGEPDCSTPPDRMCCRAMTPECMACVDQAKAEWDAFLARCPQAGVGPPSFELEAPAARQVVGVDCSKPHEPVMCCQAETPSCQACRASAERMDKNWQATCGPAGFAPPDITYDCSKPAPLTSCCRALLPKCTECVDKNRQVAAEYKIACPAR